MEWIAVVFIVLIISVALYFINKHSNKKRYWCEYNEDCEVMTVIDQNDNKKKYHGSSTVWREMPSYKRCSASQEAWLSDRWTEIRHTKINTENGLLKQIKN